MSKKLEEQIKKIISPLPFVSEVWRVKESHKVVAEIAELLEQKCEDRVMSFWSAVCVTMYQRIPKEKADEIISVIHSEMAPSGKQREQPK